MIYSNLSTERWFCRQTSYSYNLTKVKHCFILYFSRFVLSSLLAHEPAPPHPAVPRLGAGSGRAGVKQISHSKPHFSFYIVHLPACHNRWQAGISLSNNLDIRFCSGVGQWCHRHLCACPHRFLIRLQTAVCKNGRWCQDVVSDGRCVFRRYSINGG